jgi:hypothetical protein
MPVTVFTNKLLGVTLSVKVNSAKTVASVAVSSTKNGCVVASSDNILWHYIPNSNVVIQANAGYNIWGKAGTNSYKIVVK